MKRPFGQRLVFQVERFLLRGAVHRLALMAGVIVLVALAGGAVMVLLGAYQDPGEAAWWAFLRLTDPGYLGDDQGLGPRLVSTAITVAGYVLFMGALIAILTQWLQETILRLQRGETPIVLQDHLLLLGLSERTPALVEELLRSEARVRRVLRLGRSRDLRLVVLVEDLDEDVRSALADRLGPLWDDRRILLRSGSPLVAEHLDRVDFARAAVVLLAGATEREASAAESDAQTIKTVLSIAAHPQVRGSDDPPRLVAMLRDPRLCDIVQASYRGVLELVPGDAILARLVVQNLRHHGLSWVYDELLAFNDGCDLYYLELPELVGGTWGQAALRLSGGVSLGLVRPEGRGFEALLAPPLDTAVCDGDRFVVVALDRDRVRVGPPLAVPAPTPPLSPFGADWPRPRRVLVLGWSARLPDIVAELETYPGEPFELDVVSTRPPEERVLQLASRGLEQSSTHIRHLVGDYTNVRDVLALDFGRYHNVVIMGRGWAESGEDADAQTIVAWTIVRRALEGLAERPAVMVELLDPDNAVLFADAPGEVVLGPTLLAHVLAHTAVRPELQAVLDCLFSQGEADLHFRPAAELGLPPGPATFGRVQRLALAAGEVALGLRSRPQALDVRGDVDLAPDADQAVTIDDHSLVLVLSRQHPRA